MTRRFPFLALVAAAGLALHANATAAPVAGARGSIALVAGPSGLVAERMPTGDEAGVVSTLERQGRARVDDLNRRMRQTRDVALGDALAREAAQVKRETAIQILRFRAAYARAHDDVESAARFEGAISSMLHPVIQVPVSQVVKGPNGVEDAVGVGSGADSHPQSPSEEPIASAIPSPVDAIHAGENIDVTGVQPGWAAPIVVRNDATATPTNATPSPTLDNTMLNTWLNWCFTQTGSDLPNYQTTLHVDDIPVYIVIWGSAPGNRFDINQGPFSVRGGRHTIKNIGDSENVIAETNEADNVAAVQYVWSPYALASGEAALRQAPPVRGPLTYPNQDGYVFSRNSSYAWVVSLAPRQPGDDYDLWAYDNYVGSTSGFSNYFQSSGRTDNQTDFIVGHYSGTPTTFYPAATRFVAPVGADYCIDGNTAQGRNGAADANNSYTGQTLSPNRIADVYEAYLSVGTTWYFTLRRTSGNSDLRFEVFSGTSGQVGYRTSGTPGAPLGGSSTAVDILGPYTSTETGWHPIVVYRDNGDFADQAVTYDLSWNSAGFVDAPDERPTRRLEFLGATPNPVTAGATLDFVLPSPGRATLALFDLGGRRVRSLAEGDFGAGRHSVRWDGLGDSGSRLAAGVYQARFETRGESFHRTVVLMK